MKIFDNGEKLTYHNGWWHGSNAVFGHLLKSKVTIIAIGNKYSSRVYSALALSGLFEDFPYERERLGKELDRLPVDENLLTQANRKLLNLPYEKCLLLLFIILFFSCARVGAPVGGEKIKRRQKL